MDNVVSVCQCELAPVPGFLEYLWSTGKGSAASVSS